MRINKNLVSKLHDLSITLDQIQDLWNCQTYLFLDNKDGRFSISLEVENDPNEGGFLPVANPPYHYRTSIPIQVFEIKNTIDILMRLYVYCAPTDAEKKRKEAEYLKTEEAVQGGWADENGNRVVPETDSPWVIKTTELMSSPILWGGEKEQANLDNTGL